MVLGDWSTHVKLLKHFKTYSNFCIQALAMEPFSGDPENGCGNHAILYLLNGSTAPSLNSHGYVFFEPS
jgi:hypothetical protein